jgi:hypothetical protein
MNLLHLLLFFTGWLILYIKKCQRKCQQCKRTVKATKVTKQIESQIGDKK